MDFVELLDLEYQPLVAQMPLSDTPLTADVPAAREALRQMFAGLAAILPPTDVAIEERIILGPAGDLPIVIYRPNAPTPHPGLLWIHGGGYILGSPRGEDLLCLPVAERLGCTIVSVDYRLAPEHPFPAGPEDCYAALLWLADHAAELGIDVSRLAIGGGSAGGGMTAGVALMNRDRKGPALKLQLLMYPMLDDRHETSSGQSIVDSRVWNRQTSLEAWKMYLGDAYGGDVSPYAAAARATDLSGLPPAYITVGTADLFRDEDIVYAQRLMAAGVPTELAVFHGVFHGGELFMPGAAVSQRMSGGYFDALRRAFAG